MIYCLIGLPGAGKSEVVYQLFREGEVLIIPRTTDRLPRKDELESSSNPEYSFVSKHWFEVLKGNGEFVGVEEFASHSYAVRKSDLKAAAISDRPSLLMAGGCAFWVKEFIPVSIIFLSVPGVDHRGNLLLKQGEDILRRRMENRGNGKDKIEARLALARRIIEEEKLHSLSDHLVVNSDGELQETIQQVKALLH